MNRGYKLLVLLAVLAVLVGGCFGVKALTEKKEAESAAAESTAEALAIGEYDDISAMEWTYLGETVSLEKDSEGCWVCSDDESLPVDQDKADSLVSAAAAVTGELYISGAEELSEYGLEEPELTVTVTAGDSRRSYSIGDYSSLAAMYYMTVDGGSDVYLEDGSLENSFWYDKENLVQYESAPADIMQAVGLTVQSDVQSFTLLRSDEPLTLNYTDAFEWFEVQGEEYRPMDSDGAENICELVSGLSFASCVTWNASASDLADCGLDAPQCTAQLDYQDSDGAAHSYSLEFGSYADGGQVYVRLSGSDMVYLADGGSLDELMYSDLESLLPEDFLSTSGAQIAALSVSVDGTNYDLDPADEAVTEFLEQMGAVYSTGSAAGKSGRDSLFSLELHFDNEAVSSLSVSFYSYDSTSALCSAGEAQAFVSRSSAESLADTLRELVSGDGESTENETETAQ